MLTSEQDDCPLVFSQRSVEENEKFMANFKA